MLLQTVRPNIVQSIRAYRVDDLMAAAQGAGQHFLYANLTAAQSKQEVLEAIVHQIPPPKPTGAPSLQALVFDSYFQKGLPHLRDQCHRACRFGRAIPLSASRTCRGCRKAGR